MPHPSIKVANFLSGILNAWCLGVSLALWAAAAPAQSPEPSALSGDIAPQPLAAALEVFSRQTGLHVVYVSKVVREQKSHAVPAGLIAKEALARLLEGTGLRFEFLTPHSVRILVVDALPDAPPTGVEDIKAFLPEVLVTGSRIPVRLDITVASPMQVVTAEEVQLSGYADAVDVMGNLSQLNISSGSDFGNRSNSLTLAGGITTADLRGLQPQRTVVLVNGRRLGVGDPNTTNPSPAPNLDQIPLVLVDRVEVLTGGASATYGADAVAGVVNFILKDHVQGIQVDAQYGFDWHTQHNRYLESQEIAADDPAPMGSRLDGYKRDASVLAGSSFHNGDGQITGYFIYHGQAAVTGSARDFSACPFYSNTTDAGVAGIPGVSCQGSQNSNVFAAITQLQSPYEVVGNQFVLWPAAGATPPPLFNYSPYVYVQRDDKRYQSGLFSHLKLSEAARLFFEFSYMNDTTLLGMAPSGLFVGEGNETPDGGYLVNCSNPLLSAQQAGILCTPAQIAADRVHPGSVSADVLIGRRNVEGLSRLSTFEHASYRAVAGVEGMFADDWNYHVYALYYYTSLYQALNGYLSITDTERALQVTTDPAGHPVCISGGSCVPYNIFTSGAVTRQQLAYLNTSGTDVGANSEQVVAADVTGQLARYGLIAPLAHEGVAVDLGVEHRGDGIRFSPDAVELANDLAGLDTTVTPLHRHIAVSDGVLEVRAPLVQDRPFVKDLSVDAGYRYSDYSTGKSTNTYKMDLKFAPLSDLRLRASYDRVIRSPNLIELYTPLNNGISWQIGLDPCAPSNGGITRAAASLAQCLRTGVTAAQYGNGLGPQAGGTSTVIQCPNLGCGIVTGGNPGLAPETADTWSVGATLTPASVPGLSASVDYFHIRLKGEIGEIPESVTMQQCLNTGDPTVCSRIVRTPAGGLWGTTLAGGGYILGNAVNSGSAMVSGIDVQSSARQPLADWGTLSAMFSGTWVQHNVSIPYENAPGFDCAGLFGKTCLNGSVNPKWRHTLRVTWDTPWNLKFSAQWRFIGPTSFDNNSPQTLLKNQEEGVFDPYLSHIRSYSYLDFTGIWAFNKHLQFRVTVDNLLDQDPPFIPQDASQTAGQVNTFPLYDILGRNVSMAFRATF